MPDLTIHIIGIDSPLGLELASKLKVTKLQVSGTVLGRNHHKHTRRLIQQLNVPIYRSVKSAASQIWKNDYLVFVDTNESEYQHLTRQLNPKQSVVSACYKIINVYTDNANLERGFSAAKNSQRLSALSHAQICSINLLCLYGEGVSSTSSIGLAPMIRHLSKKRITIPSSRELLVKPLYLADAAASLVGLIFSPVPPGRSLMMSGPQSVTYENFAYLMQSQIHANAGKRISLSFSSKYGVLPAARGALVYPSSVTPLSDGVYRWVKWLYGLDKPTKLSLPTPKPRQQNRHISRTFLALGTVSLALSMAVLFGMARGIPLGLNAQERSAPVRPMVLESSLSLIDSHLAAALASAFSGNYMTSLHRQHQMGVNQIRYQLQQHDLASRNERLNAAAMSQKTQLKSRLYTQKTVVSILDRLLNSPTQTISVIFHDNSERRGLGGAIRCNSSVGYRFRQNHAQFFKRCERPGRRTGWYG
jgi:hypothetical protein